MLNSAIRLSTIQGKIIRHLDTNNNHTGGWVTNTTLKSWIAELRRIEVGLRELHTNKVQTMRLK